MKVRRFFLRLLTFFVIFGMFRCANEISPNGGPKDTTPPVLIGAEPPMNATSFDSRVIKVTFDEYIQLKDVSSQMVVSPPMKKKPDVMAKGKSVVIKIKDTLRPKTTYNLFFGNAFADLNEGNSIADFRYVFSTGEFIDSLSMQGKVLDALTFEPVEGAWVVLYSDHVDSTFFTTVPYYISRTDKNGVFHLNQLRDTSYSCYALEDINSNYFFDIPNERIAFLDSLVTPGYIARRPDSIPDSVAFIPVNTVPEITLYMYAEPDTIHKLLDYTLKDDYVVEFVFNKPSEEVTFASIDSLPIPDYYREINTTGDTIHWWLKNTTQQEMNLEVSLGDIVLDSIRLALTNEENLAKPSSRLFKSNLVSKTKLDANKNFIFTCDNPIDRIDFSGALLKWEGDSIVPVFIFSDTTPRRVNMTTKITQGITYSMAIPAGAITDIYGNTTDSLLIPFTKMKTDDYGTIVLDLTVPSNENSYILALNDGKKKCVRKMTILQSGEYKFSYLIPGKYTFSIYKDIDNNGIWSPGRITYRLQPERVITFPKELSIRANWEIQETWIVE